MLPPVCAGQEVVEGAVEEVEVGSAALMIELGATLYPLTNAVPFSTCAYDDILKKIFPGSLQQFVVFPPPEQQKLLSVHLYSVLIVSSLGTKQL